MYLEVKDKGVILSSKFSLADLLKIPERCIENQKLTKKSILENANLKESSKKVIRDDIDEMLIVALVDPKSSNINAYEDDNYSFDAILLIQVLLKKKESLTKVAEILHTAIPYQLVILFSYQDVLSFNIADKRINQVDKDKRVISNYTFTEWLKTGDDKLNKFIDSIAFSNLSHLNLKAFYDDIRARVYNLKTSLITGKFQAKSIEESQDDIILLRKIKEINAEILKLKNTYKKEINFNAKVKLNVEIKKLEKEKEHLKMSIKVIENSSI